MWGSLLTTPSTCSTQQQSLLEVPEGRLHLESESGFFEASQLPPLLRSGARSDSTCGISAAVWGSEMPPQITPRVAITSIKACPWRSCCWPGSHTFGSQTSSQLCPAFPSAQSQSDGPCREETWRAEAASEQLPSCKQLSDLSGPSWEKTRCTIMARAAIMLAILKCKGNTVEHLLPPIGQSFLEANSLIHTIPKPGRSFLCTQSELLQAPNANFGL